MKAPLFFASAVLTASILLSGCAMTGGTASLPDGTTKIIAQGLVEAAVIEVAAKNPATAAEIVDITHAIKLIAGTEGFNSVDLLMAEIRKRSNIASLPPAQRVLANTLLAVIEAKLRQDIGSGPIAGGKLLVVGEIAGWIEEAAASVVATK